MRLFVLLVLSLLASTLLVSSASATPIEQCKDGDHYANGGEQLWIDAWLQAGPIDPNGEGLHMFNSVGCEGYTIYFYEIR